MIINSMINPLLFLKVMLHTFMDTLRTDGDREINHHGKTIKVKDSMDDKDELFDKTTNINNGNGAPTYHNMTQRNEEELVRARKNFYDNAVTHRRDYLEFADLAGNKLQFFKYVNESSLQQRKEFQLSLSLFLSSTGLMDYTIITFQIFKDDCHTVLPNIY